MATTMWNRWTLSQRLTNTLQRSIGILKLRCFALLKWPISFTEMNCFETRGTVNQWSLILQRGSPRFWVTRFVLGWQWVNRCLTPAPPQQSELMSWWDRVGKRDWESRGKQKAVSFHSVHAATEEQDEEVQRSTFRARLTTQRVRFLRFIVEQFTACFRHLSIVIGRYELLQSRLLHHLVLITSIFYRFTIKLR